MWKSVGGIEVAPAQQSPSDPLQDCLWQQQPVDIRLFIYDGLLDDEARHTLGVSRITQADFVRSERCWPVGWCVDGSRKT